MGVEKGTEGQAEATGAATAPVPEWTSLSPQSLP